MSEEWRPPRCGHGHIILGCPHDDCPEQSDYLDKQSAAIAAWEQGQWDDARRLAAALLAAADAAEREQ